MSVRDTPTDSKLPRARTSPAQRKLDADEALERKRREASRGAWTPLDPTKPLAPQLPDPERKDAS